MATAFTSEWNHPIAGYLLLRGTRLARLDNDALARFSAENPTLRVERRADGAVLVRSPASTGDSRRTAHLMGRLGAWNEAVGRGVCFGVDAGFHLPDSAVLAASAAWLPANRWNSLTRQQQAGFAPVAPPFIVEMVAAGDLADELHEKIHAGWLANGTQLAFLIDPKTETSWTYRAGQAVPDVVAGFDRELSGEPVLPGFALDLRMLR